MEENFPVEQILEVQNLNYEFRLADPVEVECNNLNLNNNLNSNSEFKIPEIVEAIKEGVDAADSTQVAKIQGTNKPFFELKNADFQEEIATPLTDLAAVSSINVDPIINSATDPELKNSVCILRDTSPLSNISLTFKKIALKKDNSLFKKSKSPGSKHTLFKELPALGPVKDLPRRKMARIKVKNGMRGSSSLLSQ
ncbi:hypothetical protein MA16_Dca006446 [Dendrobium catenatum]|uniref:Uncharacterized protein n=1 Tax=Dendrobium catenatum TaxID=906689 RepID=A0A2I0X7W5_9ASPA|nr:hypothetical protein MA16_Dca006446 [Dendrobium catenatum]